MLSTEKNIIDLKDNIGIFFGNFNDNKMHKHYAIQLSIALEAPIHLQTNSQKLNITKGVLLQPNLKHLLFCESNHLLLLFNPISHISHYWKSMGNKELIEIESQITEVLKELCNQYLSNSITTSDFISKIRKFIKNFECDCNKAFHITDKRIEKAINFLNQNVDKIISAKEISNYCALSESRFLHLFKEYTGQTYRRAQLWNKIMNAIPNLQHNNLTKTAHKFGFTDSAHFSKTFKENFGFSPRQLLKISQFIQV